jgi:glycerol uptake facilitator-like aquaporin
VSGTGKEQYWLIIFFCFTFQMAFIHLLLSSFSSFISDFSPRLAHFVLPIPNKGPSEFYYAWIPFLAPLVGGCAGAGLYALTQLVNHSNVPGNQTFPAQ